MAAQRSARLTLAALHRGGAATLWARIDRNRESRLLPTDPPAVVPFARRRPCVGGPLRWRNEEPASGEHTRPRVLRCAPSRTEANTDFFGSLGKLALPALTFGLQHIVPPIPIAIANRDSSPQTRSL